MLESLRSAFHGSIGAHRRRRRAEGPLDQAIAAIYDDDHKALRLLLDLGLPPDARDSSGAPLLFFCAEGRVQCARLLLDRGANAADACPDGTTAPMRSARACPVCLQTFARDPSIWSQLDSAGQNILHHGAMGSSPHARISMDWACQRAPQALFGARNLFGLTPLELACRLDNPSPLAALLPRSRAFEPNPRDGATPLELCLSKGSARCAAALWPMWRPEHEPDGGARTIGAAMRGLAAHRSLQPMEPLFAQAERAILAASSSSGSEGQGAKSI